MLKEVTIPTCESENLALERAKEWRVVETEVMRRLAEPRTDSAVINFYGPEGAGKTAFLKEVVLPELQSSFSGVPLVYIDLDDKRERYAAIDGRIQFVIDVTQGLAQAAGLPVENLLAEGGNKRGALSKWKNALEIMGQVDWESGEDDDFLLVGLERIEQQVLSGFREYIFGVATKTGRPAVFVLNSYDGITNSLGQTDYGFLRLINEDVTIPATDTGLFVFVLSGKKEARPLDRNMERRYQRYELDEIAL